MSIIGTRPPLISETNFYELHHRAKVMIKLKLIIKEMVDWLVQEIMD